MMPSNPFNPADPYYSPPEPPWSVLQVQNNAMNRNIFHLPAPIPVSIANGVNGLFLQVPAIMNLPQALPAPVVVQMVSPARVREQSLDITIPYGLESPPIRNETTDIVSTTSSKTSNDEPLDLSVSPGSTQGSMPIDPDSKRNSIDNQPNQTETVGYLPIVEDVTMEQEDGPNSSIATSSAGFENEAEDVDFVTAVFSDQQTHHDLGKMLEKSRQKAIAYRSRMNAKRTLRTGISRAKRSVVSYLHNPENQDRETRSSSKFKRQRPQESSNPQQLPFSMVVSVRSTKNISNRHKNPIKVRKISKPDLVNSVRKIAEVLLSNGPPLEMEMEEQRQQKTCTFEGTIQDCACTDLSPHVTRCLECGQAGTDNESAYCRFRDFRKLSSSSHGNTPLSPIGFICQQHDLEHCFNSEAANIREWLPLTGAIVSDLAVSDGNTSNGSIDNVHGNDQEPVDQSKRAIDKETAEFILSHVTGYFRQLWNKERILLKSEFLKRNKEGPTRSCIPWKDSAGFRELCDVCSTTIFNLHVMCPDCGLSVCPDCFIERLDGILRDASRKTHDQYGWVYCTRRNDDEPMAKVEHDPTDILLAHLVPECDSEILSTLSELERQLTGCGSKMKAEKEKAVGPILSVLPKPNMEQSHWHLFNGQVLVLPNGRSPENLRLFQGHWRSSYPLIVENVHKELTASLWQSSLFADLCRNHVTYDCIVDCRTGKMKPSITVEDFWDGFTDCARRLRDKEKRKLYLKLKDWPPGEKFASVLREQYADFCSALPIPEYTHPEGGRFNLATKLPSFCLAPDLGPKMYTAYDMVFEPEKGTTNLHLDVSDAVNVLVNVTTPANVNKEYLYREILEYLEKQDLDEKDLQRAKANPQNAGALWTIFKPEDNGAIRDFLRQLIDEKRDDVDDPIHDQKIYLHRTLRQRLAERGVKGFTFVQMLGDAVFIPAGAAHQVQNLLCCIKVAEDFVSPEGVQRCAVIADEFRSLTKDHTNHEDKLQLPNIVTHAIRQCIAELNSDK